MAGSPPPPPLQVFFLSLFSSLKNFFKKASDMLYFKRLIQIPRLPEVWWDFGHT